MPPRYNFTAGSPWGWIIAVLIILSLLGNMGWLLPIVIIAAIGYAIWQKQQGKAKFVDISGSDGSRFSFGNLGKWTGWIFGALVLLAILIRSIVVIPAGATGVVHVFGKVRDRELPSGIHLVNPLAQVEKMSIRTQDFSMTKAREGGAGDAITVLTKEGLDVTLDITVLYRLTEVKASDVFKEFGPAYEERLIRPVIRSAIRQVIAEFEAKDIYSARRQEVVKQLRELLTQEFEPRGIALEEVLMRDVELPEKLTQSIQEKLTAEQEAQRYTFILETAKKEAERKRIEAAGQRDSQKIISESLTPNYLNYLYIRELKDRQGTIYVPTNPQTGLPLFQNIGR
jgi:regulator of protease activity HflC (stomatin/prohibitin superfamily)